MGKGANIVILGVAFAVIINALHRIHDIKEMALQIAENQKWRERLAWIVDKGMSCSLSLIIGLGIAVVSIIWMLRRNRKAKDLPRLPTDGWWGRGERPSSSVETDTSIRTFKVNVDDAVLEDLKERLKRTRFAESFENAQFRYGFHSRELKKIVNFWLTEFDWRKQEKILNSQEQFLTKIEGIDVHFIRARANTENNPIPILIVHGWPGSVVEFYKLLPILVERSAQNGVPLEIICPSIPGYGFSEAPHQPGFSAYDAARIFDKLMARLGHKQYYVQGGDWGSVIVRIMATFYPDRVRGLLLNMTGLVKPNLTTVLKFIFGLLAPKIMFRREEQGTRTPFGRKVFRLLEESGYFHIQATKPDTIGASLTDSPAGLAAYMLEKFSTGTDIENVKAEDGGLTKKFTFDELLTNVMIYWITGNITSSLRFYKENIAASSKKYEPERLQVKVPTGISYFPNEGLNLPVSLINHVLVNIVHCSYQSRGGHFAAMEEPELLADEIFTFIEKVEKMQKNRTE